MAAALRFAARRLCGRALERPPPALFAATAKEVPARIIHGGRPFSSFQSPPNLVNSKMADVVLPHDSPLLLKDLDWNTRVRVPPWSPGDPKYLQGLLIWAAGTLALASAVVYVEANYIFDRPMLGRETASSKRTRIVRADVDAASIEPSAT